MHAQEHILRRQSLGLLHEISGYAVGENIRLLQNTLKKYNPNQPRIPRGNSDGGQWTSGGGGSPIVAPQPEKPTGRGTPPIIPSPASTEDLLRNILRGAGINIPDKIILSAIEGGPIYEGSPDEGIDSVYPELLLLPVLRGIRGLYSLLSGVGDLFGGASSEPTPSTQDILNPNGQPIGRPGNSPRTREMEGGAQGAKDLYDQLSKGGKPDTRNNYPGESTRLPNGDWVGHRPTSKSGPATVDINVDNVPFRKIKFPE